MYDQLEEFQKAPAIRDGQISVVTCEACGCRLQHDAATETWHHFGAIGGRDARSHLTACIDLPHDAFGRAAVPA